MGWLARDKYAGQLCVFYEKPHRRKLFNEDVWECDCGKFAPLNTMDADEKLIGRHLTWEDEPVEV